MEELLGIGVAVADAELGETVGALVVELLGHLPRAGDKVELARGATAEVTGISRRRVTRVRVAIRKEPEPSATPG
jgi:Mg2+/Co2+ transporter CorC